MATRRPHTKSRLGCVRCKQKHVKCDEVRPTCGTCARYEVPCVVQPASASSSRADSRRRALLQPQPNGGSASPSTSPTPTISPSPQANQPRSSLTLWEFELLHHWIINVADSFDISPGFHRSWREQAVTAATHFEFFMHMILILSALHLALTNSPTFTEKHRELILNGCSDAMSAFRKEAEDINDNNCEVIQAFPFLVVVYGLALAQFDRTEKSKETVLDETIHILILIKAHKIIGDTTKPILHSKSGKRWVVEEDILITPRGDLGDSNLISAIKNVQSWIDESGDEENVRAINTRAACMIIEPMTYILMQNIRPLVWPYLLEDDYLGLLTARNPMALVILAHYAVILNQSRSQWWCANWGARIVSVVVSCLPERFIPAIAYPLQKQFNDTQAVLFKEHWHKTQKVRSLQHLSLSVSGRSFPGANTCCQLCTLQRVTHGEPRKEMVAEAQHCSI
ncbi:hypothetical protein BJX63DRAFT_430037 [Aspergillus granulosus]|uniref:Zn(2)-C6 fungal-type domain-containing protein n=1 Tax=Aspergillus granulosus TaxID=176169 RepID=A0ABR4HQJ2_9EURO